MQKETSKFNDSDIMEGMSSISAVIKAIENKCSDRRVISVYVDIEKKRSKYREISFLERKSKELGFMVEFVDSATINEVSTGNSHGGIIAFCTPRTIPALTVESIKIVEFITFLKGSKTLTTLAMLYARCTLQAQMASFSLLEIGWGSQVLLHDLLRGLQS